MSLANKMHGGQHGKGPHASSTWASPWPVLCPPADLDSFRAGGICAPQQRQEVLLPHRSLAELYATQPMHEPRWEMSVKSDCKVQQS